ncbi:MAG: GNAT family N-acetyltransferase [Gammaproteobacteria bacterium]|nr:GNAT family N-acetyltransferase [Gammaproteobacteria bacterium]
MNELNIVTAYRPGLIGRIAELHALYYSREWRFGHFFEAKVATELSEFINRYDESLDGIWSLLMDGCIEGSITIDGSAEEPGVAHLRWFIVSDKARGTGAGGQLMSSAVTFCKQRSFKKVYLWTFDGLAPARHLYRKFGFELVEELHGNQWGTTVTEQRYELNLT